MPFWEYEPEDTYAQRRAREVSTRPTRTTGSVWSRPRQQPAWAERFQNEQGQVTAGSAARGGLDLLLDTVNAPAEYVGKPLLGAITAAAMPGQQVQTDPSKGLWQNASSVYNQWRDLEEQRDPLFEFDLGPIHVSEKWLTENILADPLFWVGIGGATKTAKGLKMLQGAGFGDDVLKLAAKGQIDDVIKLVGRQGLGDDALRALKTGKLLNQLDTITSPLSWPGAAGRTLVGAAKGETLTPVARWAADLMGESKVGKGIGETLGRGAELGGWAMQLQPRAALSPLSVGMGLVRGESLPRAVSGAFGLDELAEGVGMDRWLAPLAKRGKELAASETGALRMGRGAEVPGKMTTARGADPTNRYEFQYKVMELDDLIVSHTDTFEENPDYSQELQQRNRSREASKAQVDHIAQTLVPEEILTDTGVLDRGPIIIGDDRMVESGNGRTLALRQVRRDMPEKMAVYRAQLLEVASQFGIDPKVLEYMETPILVRERTSEVDRPQFAKEANEPSGLVMSAAEKAEMDAEQFPEEAIVNMTISEGESIDKALTASRNDDLVKAFMQTLPANQRAALMDQKGNLNQEGLSRLKTAIFARTYPGDAGRRLTAIFSESLDSGIRRLQDGLFGSLPQMARAESLIRQGARDESLSMTDDLGTVVDVMARLRAEGQRRGSAYSVDEYLKQQTMFERELTPEQEGLLRMVDEISNSSKKTRTFIQEYAKLVEAQPATNIDTLTEVPRLTREEILDRAIENTRQATGAQLNFAIPEAAPPPPDEAREKLADGELDLSSKPSEAVLAQRAAAAAAQPPSTTGSQPTGAPAATGPQSTAAQQLAQTKPIAPLTGPRTQPGVGTQPQLPGGVAPTVPPNTQLPPGGNLELAREGWARADIPWFKRIWDWLKNDAETELLDRFAHLNELQAKTGIPTHDLAKLVGGAESEAMVDLMDEIDPIFKTVGEDGDDLITYATLMRGKDGRDHYGAGYKLPGGVQDPDIAIAELGAEVKARPDGTTRWNQIVQGQQDLVLKFNKLVIAPQLAEGILDPDDWKRMHGIWKNYISFARQGFDLDSLTTKTKAEASVDERIYQAALEDGSVRRLDQPKDRMYAEVVRARVRIARNRAAKSVVQALTVYGQQTGQTLASLGKNHSGGRGTIHYYKGGKKVEAHVPVMYERVAKGLDAESGGLIMALLRKPADVLRAGATSLNPGFVIANPIRDLISAWFSEGVHPLSLNFWQAIGHTIAHDDTWKRVARSGALNAGLTEVARKPDALPEKIASIGKIEVKSLGDALLFLPRFVMEANEVAEQATRVACWTKLEAEGVPALERAVRTRDVTVDFRQSGNATRVLNQVIPFLNAGVQGAANTVKIIKKDPALAFQRFLPLLAGTILCQTWNQRFKETKDLIPDYEYTDNWIFQVGEGQEKPDPEHPSEPGEKFPIYVKVPKGPMASALTALPEAMMRAAFAEGDYSVLDHLLWAGKTSLNAMMPIEATPTAFIPPGLDTMVQIASNRDWFRGKDIVPQSEWSRPVEEQYGQETSKVATALGKALRMSPRLIDFAITDTTAGAGKTGLWITDLALGAMGYDPAVPGAAKVQEQTGWEQAAANPIAGRFVGTRNTAFMRSGYDNLDKALADSQRTLYQNPEVKRFGIGFQAPADTVTINGQPRSLTPEQRSEIITQSTPLVGIAFDRLIERPTYQQADDAERRKMMTAVRSKILENVRSRVIAPMTGEQVQAWGEEEARLLPMAYEQYLEYQKLPRYLGLTEEQIERGTAADAAIRRMRQANPMLPTETARAIYAQQDPTGARLTQVMGQLQSPLRRRYWASHPLLSIFFGGMSPAELASALPMYTQAMQQETPNWAGQLVG